MDSKRRVMGHAVVIAAVGVLPACKSDTTASKEEGRTGAAANAEGGGEAGGAGGSGENALLSLQAQPYDAEHDCFGERTPIDGLYSQEQYEHTNASAGPVCIISPAGGAYVAALGTSSAILQNGPVAEWTVPVWIPLSSAHYDYSAFSPDEQALCDAAMMRWWATPGYYVSCTDEEQETGGAGSGGHAGAAGSLSGGGESSHGGSAGSVSAGAAGVLVEGDAGADQGGTGNGGRGGSGGAWSCINPACEGLAEEPCVDAGCAPYYGEPWMEPGVTRYAGCITPFEQRSAHCEAPVSAEICGGPSIGTHECWNFISGFVPDGWVILEEAAGCESIPECGDRPPVP